MKRILILNEMQNRLPDIHRTVSGHQPVRRQKEAPQQFRIETLSENDAQGSRLVYSTPAESEGNNQVNDASLYG